jgi:hypothetical protein
MVEEKSTETPKEKVETPVEPTVTPEQTTPSEPAGTAPEKVETKPDEANVPSFRLREEREKREAAEAELQAMRQKLEHKPPQQDPISYLEKQFPQYKREDLEVMFQIANMTGAYHAQLAQVNAVNRHLQMERAQFKGDKYYQRYKGEIDTEIAKLPLQEKMKPGAVSEVLERVKGRHVDEIIAEVTKGGKPSEKPPVIKGSKPAAPVIGKGATSPLSVRQQAEFDRMTMNKPEDYLDILGKHKALAKRYDLPEPELLSDPFRK